MHRFFVSSTAKQNQTFVLADENYKHIKTVLRLKINDEILLCDGIGNDYHCRIESIGDQFITAQILFQSLNAAESNLKITLFQALPKLDKMDLIIEKAVELGVHTIVPIVTAFTLVKAQDEREQKKLKRWNTISEAAAKQSGRGIIPVVQSIHSFRLALDYAQNRGLSNEKCFIAYEKEATYTIKQAIQGYTGKQLGLFIGSEGGFSEGEIAEAISAGICPVTLGKRILRTETAALAAVSMINYELEL